MICTYIIYNNNITIILICLQDWSDMSELNFISSSLQYGKITCQLPITTRLNHSKHPSCSDVSRHCPWWWSTKNRPGFLGCLRTAETKKLAPKRRSQIVQRIGSNLNAGDSRNTSHPSILFKKLTGKKEKASSFPCHL